VGVEERYGSESESPSALCKVCEDFGSSLHCTRFAVAATRLAALLPGCVLMLLSLAILIRVGISHFGGL
jgi:hypothetical protein